MSRLRVRGREPIRALQKVGFAVIRIKGSHHFMRHADERATAVPVHAGETIGPGLLGQERLKSGKNCRLTLRPAFARVAPCLVSPKTNSPSPARR